MPARTLADRPLVRHGLPGDDSPVLRPMSTWSHYFPPAGPRDNEHVSSFTTTYTQPVSSDMPAQHPHSSFAERTFTPPTIPSMYPNQLVSPLRNVPLVVPTHAHLNIPPGMSPPWHSQLRALPPPPPVVHKVWILDCKSCGTFLTNRGMKAVLLLRPNVPLYSTDALPINCSAYSPVASSSRSSSPSASGSSLPNLSQSHVSASAPRAARTCECLTQTLCCHGCGTAIGYMIVNPCRRCTSSISASNRTTNGHRFVFYSAEVAASERHYVPGERGVIQFHPPPPTVNLTHTYNQQAPFSAHGSISGHGATNALRQFPHASPVALSYMLLRRSQGDADADAQQAQLDSPVSDTSDSMPSLLLLDELEIAGSPSQPTSPESAGSVPPPPTRVVSAQHTAAANSPEPASAPVRQASSSTGAGNEHGNSTATSAVPTEAGSGSSVIVPSSSPQSLRIKAGEVLYWHNLVRSGEIPPVSEDPRARRKGHGGSSSERSSEGEDAGKDVEERGKSAKFGVFAGR